MVLGVGRSGTSALTRVLNLRGAALPREILPPGVGNERGHWEPAWLAVLNHQILDTIGCGYETAAPMPRGWFETPQAHRFLRLTSDLLADQYPDGELIVVKEPRLCRLAPIAFAALELIGFSTRVVLPVRHPSEVVRSFRARDRSGPKDAELRWIRHMLEAEAASRSYPRIWVGFDEVLADWRTMTWRIGAQLRLAWPIEIEAAAPEIDAFLEPSLRHYDVMRNVSDLEVGDLARRLWRAARCGIGGDEVRVRQEFDSVRLVIDELDRLGSGTLGSVRQRASSALRDSAA